MIIVTMFASLVLTGVFLASSLPKLRHPKRFVLHVFEYQVLPSTFSFIYGWTLPPLELLLAFFLLTGTAVRLAAFIVAMLFSSFIFAIVLNMLRGRTLDCYCFGTKVTRKADWVSLIQDGVLLGIAFWLCFVATQWFGIETWSVFHLFHFATTLFLLPYVICFCVTGSIALLLKKIPVRREVPNI